MEELVYLPTESLFLYANKGTGDNLLDEDLEAGYVSYANVQTYCFEDGEFVEEDGGMSLLKKPFEEEFPEGTEEKLARFAIEQMFDKQVPFIILNSQIRVYDEEVLL